jgi:hypothetical protein
VPFSVCERPEEGECYHGVVFGIFSITHRCSVLRGVRGGVHPH